MGPDKAATANPLSGLLGDYASSSDEGPDPTTVEMENGGLPRGELGKETALGQEEGAQRGGEGMRGERKRKERAERVRLWKESRSKQGHLG